MTFSKRITGSRVVQQPERSRTPGRRGVAPLTHSASSRAACGGRILCLVPSPPRTVRRLLPAAAIAVLALVGISSCDHGGDHSPAGRSGACDPHLDGAPRWPPLDTSRLSVARASFCDRVAPTAVEAALAGHGYDDTSYDNGDRARLRPVSATWRTSTAARGPRATAPRPGPGSSRPRSPPRRRASLARAELRPGCTRTTAEAGFGLASVATTCGRRVSGAGTELGYHGLFGDAWLSCTLTAPRGPEPADLADRADHWCAAVAQAASA